MALFHRRGEAAVDEREGRREGRGKMSEKEWGRWWSNEEGEAGRVLSTHFASLTNPCD
jgi:hypothetical protein